MAKPWLTGEKIMDRYGLAAAELGRLCHEGRLIAYLPEIVKPIYDLSTIEKIPKYPSIWVSSDKHIQIGETVRWDWEIILGVDKLRQELREIASTLMIFPGK
ncbi:hypothetical protein FACS189460_5030 [Deltaproteobacteria bacterium]|nr:hypothetical protein FACS189460_5030 [Deltaproteobacteria bacterium]